MASSSRSAFNVVRRVFALDAAGRFTDTNPALDPLRSPGNTSSTFPLSPAPRSSLLTCLAGSFARFGSTLTINFPARFYRPSGQQLLHVEAAPAVGDARLLLHSTHPVRRRGQLGDDLRGRAAGVLREKQRRRGGNVGRGHGGAV